MRGAITDPRPHRTNGSHLSNACHVASGIAPSWASRRRGHRAVFPRPHITRTTLGTTLSAHVGMCAQYRMLYLTTLGWQELDRLGWMNHNVSCMYDGA
jgi:hypothetical protein